MRWQVPANTNGMRSLANPGSTPVTNRLAPLAAVVFSILVMAFCGITPPRVLQGVRRRPDDVDAGGEEAHHVVERLDRAGVAHRAVDDAIRLLGDDRVEIVDGPDAGRGVSSPASVAASTSTFSGLDTHTATSSNRESSISWVSDNRPTLPVPTRATRMGMARVSLHWHPPDGRCEHLSGLMSVQ